MSNDLRCVVSVSGFRGIVGETIDPETVMKLAAAYGRSIAKGGSVVLGRDSRPTGPLFADAVATGLRGVGCDVIDIGVVPTPTVPLMIQEFGAGGGIQVSASHNPVEWNALKCYSPDGRNIDKKQLETLLQAYAAGGSWQSWSGLGRRTCDTSAPQRHIDAVLASVDSELIAKAGLTVLCDSVNGAGARVAPDLLEALGCRVVPLYANIDRVFPRDPEPNATNVRETGAVVSAVGADIGFVQDPDADRLAIIDEKGVFIGEEYTLVLCAAARMAAAKAAGVAEPVACTNLSTSRMIEDVAASLGGRVVRSAVGEANVLDAMQQEQAVLGGEGNGGVIDPRVVWCRDSQVGMALVLEYMARTGSKLSELVASIPTYAMHKEKVGLDRAAVAKIIDWLPDHAVAAGADIDVQDGIKLMWSDRWVHLRASGTEPVSRIISEAPSNDIALALADAVRGAVGAQVVTGH